VADGPDTPEGRKTPGCLAFSGARRDTPCLRFGTRVPPIALSPSIRQVRSAQRGATQDLVSAALVAASTSGGPDPRDRAIAHYPFGAAGAAFWNSPPEPTWKAIAAASTVPNRFSHPNPCWNLFWKIRLCTPSSTACSSVAASRSRC